MEHIYEYIANIFINEGIVIAVGAFVIGQILKSINCIDNKYIPLIGGIIGVVLGLTIPTFVEGKDLITSAVVGLTLGWGATGGYETIKQLKK